MVHYSDGLLSFMIRGQPNEMVGFTVYIYILICGLRIWQ